MSEALETGLPTPAEGKQPIPEGQQTQPPPEDQKPEGEQEPPKSYTQEDLDRIVKKVRSNTRYQTRKEVEAEVYRQLALQRTEPQPQAPVSNEPKREAFEDYEAYIEARAEWKAEQALLKHREAEKKQSVEQTRATEAQKLQARYQDTVEAARVELPDFDEVVGEADIPITDAMRDAILDSPLGAKLTYHLAKHPEEVERIARMSPVQQLKAIGVIEASLSSPVKTTKAPAPIKPIGGASSVSRDPSRMSMDEYVVWRKSQGFR